MDLVLSERLAVKPEVTFRALADGTRQRLLAVLTRQELSVSELVEVLGQPQSTVSRHLKVLREGRLIKDRRQGSTVLYSAAEAQPDGNGANLTARVLEWVLERQMPPPLRARLDRVMRRRREMSNRFFSRLGRQWDAIREESFGPTFHLEAFFALLPPHQTIVDIGVGTGYLLPAVAGHFDRVIGIDPVAVMLEAASQRVDALGLSNVELCEGDLSHLPIADGVADVALAMLVLHHVASPRQALAELRRVVRAGGSVLIVEQAAHEDEAFRDRMQDRWWGFDPVELAGLLEASGFVNVRSRALRTVGGTADAPELFVLSAQCGKAAADTTCADSDDTQELWNA